MALFAITTLLSLALLPLTSACPSLNTTHTKRWFGVPITTDPSGKLLTPGPWPVLPDEPNPQPLRYCFAQQSDFDSLNAIVLAAVELWKQALTPNSALDIILDKGGKEEACICDAEGVRGEALRIKRSEGVASTTVG